MTQKTNDYTIFKFRNDNREKIDLKHVSKLMESIKSKNLLEWTPISVNSKMEVIDGQHRLEAAKALQIPIYYKVIEHLEGEDIIRMNISKPWQFIDYLNYYCKNGFPEYLKLDQFMKENNLTIKIALLMMTGIQGKSLYDFRLGKFVFDESNNDADAKICWNTIRYIKMMNGESTYTASARFWRALLIIVKHNDFNEKVWMNNLSRNVYKLRSQSRVVDYIRLFMDIYNYRNPNKIILDKEFENE